MSADPAPTATKRTRRQRPRLGIALSGGGHRASLWALGALYAVVDVGAHEETVSIASVSGGSITNGVVAARVPFSQTSRQQLEDATGPAIRQWARDGLFFTGAATDPYVGWLFFWCGLLAAIVIGALATLATLSRDWGGEQVVPFAAALSILTLAGVALAGRKLAGQYLLPLLAGTSVVVATTTGGIAAATASDRLLVAIAVGLAAVLAMILVAAGAVRHFTRRSEVVARALHRGLLHEKKLAEADGPVHHVFCATDLSTAEHAYFSPRLVYGHKLGIAQPAPALDLATAVQASACLPGAFGPRTLRREHVGVGLTGDPIVLTDGGVYDNMADQWEFGYANRAAELARAGERLEDRQTDPADELVVVNASRGFTKEAIAPRGILGEVTALIRCKDVLYDVSTAVRRRYLVDMFDLAATNRRGSTGVLVHIGQPPTRVPEGAAKSTIAARKDRADKALDFLERLSALDPVDWKSVVNANASVPTTLGPVGVDAAARLLHHAYVLTRINLYVILGRGQVPPASTADSEVLATWGFARFDGLVARSTDGGEP